MLSLSISQMLSSSSSEETSNSNTATSTTTKTATSQSQPASNISSSSASSSSSKPLIAMEEVWKDINLSSITETPNLHQHQQIRSTHHRPSTTSFRPSTNIFQDFLARPFGNEPHISLPQAPTRRTMNHSMASDFSTLVTSNTTAKAKATTRATLFGSLNASSSSCCSSPSPPTIPTNHPVSALNLNSSPDFRFPDSPVESLIRPNNTSPISNIYSFTNPFESLPCSSGKKRFPSSEDSDFTTNSSGGDRRHKRMIKNRESAARSRARKQAYTAELENRVDFLEEENAKLKKQQELLNQEITAQLPKKNSLQRTSTAPF